MLYNLPGMIHPHGKKDEFYVDIGAYGAPRVEGFEAVPATKNLEKYVRKVNGYVHYVNSFPANGNLSSADNLCKELGPRSGPTSVLIWI